MTTHDWNTLASELKSLLNLQSPPLAETSVEPDVVFMRINAKQAMILSDAVPGLRFEGKPRRGAI